MYFPTHYKFAIYKSIHTFYYNQKEVLLKIFYSVCMYARLKHSHQPKLARCQVLCTCGPWHGNWIIKLQRHWGAAEYTIKRSRSAAKYDETKDGIPAIYR